MKYKPGDVVHVRDDLIFNAPYDAVGVVNTLVHPLNEVEHWCRAIQEICEYAGQWVTISGISEDFYITTEETGGELELEEWDEARDYVLWAPGMFDELEYQKKDPITEVDLLAILD